jgi:hypothetical protein
MTRAKADIRPRRDFAMLPDVADFPMDDCEHPFALTNAS